MEKQDDPKAVMSVYGFAEEATKFDLRHPLWHQRMPRLAHAIDLAFTRIQTMNTPEEKFVYFYGTLIAEDFMEILLVPVNGYGVAAMKLLRSMYEHTVTLCYLHDHPDEVGKFMAYDHVQQYKLVRPIGDTFGPGVLPPQTVEDVERRYAQVKEQFMVTDCKKCDTKKVNHTWNKLDFVSMAKKTGAIGTLIVPGYFFPLRHAHSTFRTITDRLEKRDGHLGFQRESQPKLADEALMTAHNCLLVALEIQNERFKVEGLEAEMQACLRDWAEIWSLDSLLLKDDGESDSNVKRTTVNAPTKEPAIRSEITDHHEDGMKEKEEEIKPASPTEVLPPEDATKEDEGEAPFTFLEYLDSDRGHEIAKEVLSLWKELQKVTIGSKSDQTKEELRRNHEAWRLGIVMQTALAGVVIVTAGVLAWHSKMDATIAGFLGVALGYVLGRKTS
jgi:hypothetical protein